VSPTGVEEWVPVALSRPPDGAPHDHDGDHDGDRLPLARPARRGAGSVSQFARADAWWPIPAGQTDFATGADISVLPLDMTG
jgi:hypothetical protein